MAGPEGGAGAKTCCPAARSSPARRTCSPATAGAETQTWSPSVRVFSTMATASAPSGKGAPVMIRSASPGPTGLRGACPAASVPITVNRAGRSAFGTGRIGGPDRVAVHGRVVERRHVLGRGHRLRQDQAQGGVEFGEAGRFGRQAWTTSAWASSRGIMAGRTVLRGRRGRAGPDRVVRGPTPPSPAGNRACCRRRSGRARRCSRRPARRRGAA